MGNENISRINILKERKTMDKNQKNKIQLIILVIILIGVIVLAVKVFNKEETSEKGTSGEKTGTSAIDINDPAYEGKKVYEKDGDIIIEDKDGSKTIETTKTKEDTGLKETTEETKEKYQITDVNVSTRGTNTIPSESTLNSPSLRVNPVSPSIFTVPSVISRSFKFE